MRVAIAKFDHRIYFGGVLGLIAKFDCRIYFGGVLGLQ